MLCHSRRRSTGNDARARRANRPPRRCSTFSRGALGPPLTRRSRRAGRAAAAWSHRSPFAGRPRPAWRRGRAARRPTAPTNSGAAMATTVPNRGFGLGRRAPTPLRRTYNSYAPAQPRAPNNGVSARLAPAFSRRVAHQTELSFIRAMTPVISTIRGHIRLSLE